jgi:predicted dehydrogenase
MRASTQRRTFLKSSAALAAASALPAWFLEEAVAQQPAAASQSPNEKPGVALIGCGNRGRGIGAQAAQLGNMVAYCDLDDARLDLAKKQWPRATEYKDFRKLLEQKDVDIVVNGTPDHWHTLVNLAALKAGKDIYSEKPLTLTIDEGRRLVAAVRESKRILQTGSQQRSDKNFRLACELVRNGRLGNLTQVSVWLPSGRREGPFEKQPVPAGLNWDMWQGQSPETEFVPERCHQSFRYWWEYSGGTMTDWGAHHLDIAQWGTGHDRSGPVSIEARPLVTMIPGGFTAFSEYEVNYSYANSVKLICKSTPANNWSGGVIDKDGQQHGIKFVGDGGWIFVSRGKIEASEPELLTTPLPASATRVYSSDNHMGNFFECVGTRQSPICDAEIGHRSVSMCHLGVIALRLGRKLAWDPAKEKFAGDNDANAWLSREMRKPWTYEAV